MNDIYVQMYRINQNYLVAEVGEGSVYSIYHKLVGTIIRYEIRSLSSASPSGSVYSIYQKLVGSPSPLQAAVH